MKVQAALEVSPRIVAIVHYRAAQKCHQDTYNDGAPPQNPACLLQVSILASCMSPSGRLIRFGTTGGDEINGWTKLDAIEVVEILGELAPDCKTVTPIISASVDKIAVA